MSDHISLPSPTIKFRSRPVVASLISSPGFSPKGFLDTEPAVMSPTSILEPKPFTAEGIHFFYDRKSRITSSNTSSDTKLHPWDIIGSKKVGLGIVDTLSNTKSDNKSAKAVSRMVLKVQIPSTSQNPVSPNVSVDSPRSLIEFGLKNKNSRLAMALLSPAKRSPLTPTLEPSPPVLCFSPSEMELSEDYTRVVSHGPNPRTIHIFDSCTLESCSNGVASFRKVIRFSDDVSNSHPPVDFLAFCQSCRKKLEQGKDIFMYRGEQAFCSHECRKTEMFFSDEIENSAQHRPLAP